ncbi:MAG: CoA-binding protein [Sneathiella sp.]|uniref:CoA-binding protein n=1 Tax=Sneathiella sp. TaxID=1964365 RepID=UPI003001A8B4
MYSSCDQRLNIGPLIEPVSIAVVGVSVSDPHSWGHRVVRVLIDGGYQGDVSVIHPHNQFPGVETVKSLHEKSGLDLVVICVPAKSALSIVREARETGARAVVVFASEFAESSEAGEALQEELVEAAGDMVMLGPNCFGVSNRITNVKISAAPFLNNALLPPGPVALIAQSGALGLVLSRCVEEAGVGYSHFISVGNEATLTASAIALEMIERDEVKIVMLYLETLRDPEMLAKTATRASELGKHVVVLSGGRSDAGQRAALSHTAAIAGNDSNIAALCRDFGIVRIRDDEDVKPVLAALERGWRLPSAPRVCILSNSGGAGTVLADRLVEEGARVESLSDTTRSAISEIGMIGAGDANPIDIGGGWEATLDKVEPTLKALEADADIDALVVYFAFGDMIAEKVAPIAYYCSEMSKPTLFIWQIAPADGLPLVATPGILATSMGEGVRMVKAQMRIGSGKAGTWTNRHGEGVILPNISPPQRTITELESAQLLDALGLTVVESVSGSTKDFDDIIAQVVRRGWQTLVVKANAHDIAHRNKHSLVSVGIQVDELPDILRDFGNRLDTLSNDPNRCLIVQPMISFDSEIGIGGLNDPRFGPILMVGSGGVNIETEPGHRETLMLNTDDNTQIKFARRVEKNYGLSPGTLTPVIDAIARLLRTDRVAEIDINPMVQNSKGLFMALDALIIVDEISN